jgi:hypothetical protein
VDAPQEQQPQDRDVRVLPPDALGVRTVPSGWNARVFVAYDAVDGQTVAAPIPLPADAGCFFDLYSAQSDGARSLVPPAPLPITAAGGVTIGTVPPNDALRCEWSGTWTCARPPETVHPLGAPAAVSVVDGNTRAVFNLPADVKGRIFTISSDVALTAVFARAPRPDEADAGAWFMLSVNVGGTVHSALTTVVPAAGGGYTWATLPLGI